MGKIMKKWTLILVCTLIALTSCVSELDKYYTTPAGLKGNAWEVLDSKGNFKLFMSAVARTSFKDLVQGKGQITVMAPTDSAFQVYLAKYKYTTVNDIPVDVLEKLVGYHLVYYSFNKEAFEDYKPNGVESENVLKGTYYKFRTKSRDGISTMIDPTTVNNASVKVIHKDRFLPVLSFNLFASLGIDAKANYEFFYPNSKWTGATGFNVSNASVKDYAIVTDNGYVYTINQVLEPLETVYTELSKATDYSQFKQAYDRFSTFVYDAKSTTDYGNGDSLFIQNHGDLAPIASEWTNYNLLGATDYDYTQLSSLASRAYNVFAPDNASMQAFFTKYWAPYYNNISEVNFMPLYFLLVNHVFTGEPLFPETIEKGLIKSAQGTIIQFSRSSAKMKSMCVNGTLYGLDHVLVPPVFNKVTSPMFCDPQYNMILDMMINSGFELSLVSDQVKYSVFYPSNTMISTNTTLEGKDIRYINSNAKKYGAQELQINGDNGWAAMQSSQKKSFAGNHIATQLISTQGDQKIYRTINSFNYLYTKGNQIYSSAIFNTGDVNKAPTFTKIAGDWTNGDAYSLSGVTASALVPESNQFKNVITSLASPADYLYFKAIINSSGIATSSPPYSFMQGARFIVLIPSSAVMLAGLKAGQIPTTPAAKAANFLKPYFIDVNASNMVDYPFPGEGVQGKLVSFGTKSNGQPATFTLVDKGNGTNLQIIDAKGNIANVISYFPRIYADGAAYIIDRLLEVE